MVLPLSQIDVRIGEDTSSSIVPSPYDMAPSAVVPRRRRTVSPKNSADSDELSLLRRRSSSSSLEEATITTTHEVAVAGAGHSDRRPMLERPVTPEMESIEKGTRSLSVFDVLLPFSKIADRGGTLSRVKLSTEENEDDQTSLVCDEGHHMSDSDVHKYMSRREMTPLQERVNGITVIPAAFYCFLYLLSGAWLDEGAIEDAGNSLLVHPVPISQDDCIQNSWFPRLHALPPLPVIAVAVGIICHAPFSFIYHWSYAHRLPAGFARTNHWSRRWDQAMIHFCSGCMAYATSGQLNFFLANLIFNADCIYRQFKPKVRPKRNQVRIAISCVAYTIPILRRGDWQLFGKLWCILSISFILFGFYPIGGWSHAAFHLVISFVPPLLFDVALDLPASQDQLTIAAQCAAFAREATDF